MGDQLKNKQDAESSEDELIEDDGHELASTINAGPCMEPDTEIICANAVPDRKRYLDELMKSIKAKGQEAEDKRRKLDPTNSGDSPSAINGNVEHASEDIVQERIKRKGQPASFKRGPNFEAPNAEGQGSKFRKKEMQSILNLIEAGKTR